MKKILILGAGTAGTMLANKLTHVLSRDEWKITLVDQDETHYYQPGFLFMPFGIYGENDVIKPKRDFIPPGVEMILGVARDEQFGPIVVLGLVYTGRGLARRGGVIAAVHAGAGAQCAGRFADARAVG